MVADVAAHNSNKKKGGTITSSSPNNNRDLLLSPSDKTNDYHAHTGSSFKIKPFNRVKYDDDNDEGEGEASEGKKLNTGDDNSGSNNGH